MAQLRLFPLFCRKCNILLATGAVILRALSPVSAVCAVRRIVGPHGAADQQLGGLLMWVPGGVLYLVAALALLVGWLARSRLPGTGEEGSALLKRQ
jgi:cytochrome c oxidase assembly factor CtaG